MKMVFNCSINKGQLVAPVEYFNHLRTFKEAEPVEVTVEKYRKTRSGNQSRYYFGVIVKILSDELGYTKDEIHEILKGKFLSEEIKVGDEVIRYAKSTTSLKTDAFESLMTDIREWASTELGIFLPLPNEIVLDY